MSGPPARSSTYTVTSPVAALIPVSTKIPEISASFARHPVSPIFFPFLSQKLFALLRFSEANETFVKYEM